MILLPSLWFSSPLLLLPLLFYRLQSEELPRDVSGQIELDLPRTFPNNKRVAQYSLPRIPLPRLSAAC